ncbi:SDR family oxidoreductase [uncultured Cedecea sp.]|uniref:SDR family oxidoreductase n=1 Tax=uncultured Cedecea sp. TaxID=988762 RepID=UPI0026142271|nr:SDR family oxidoreductase [uncultured Cedecea sp.]
MNISRRSFVLSAGAIAVLSALGGVSEKTFAQISQAAARHMTQGGRIISIGTTNAVRVPRQSRVAYATTKSALVGMTKAMAHDYAEQGITVNLINPGPTRTGMLGDDDSPAVQQMLSFCAIKKLAMPQDIAGLVEFVAREEAWFMTGAVLAIDGGYTA